MARTLEKMYKEKNSIFVLLLSTSLNITFFIGNRMKRMYRGSFSRPVIRIATSSIALSVAVMIVSVVIVKGFQFEIRNKVIGFSGHIRIKPYQMSVSEQQIPIDFNREDIKSLKTYLKTVSAIRPTAEKAGIIKTDEQIEGCIFKGIINDYFSGFFENMLVSGHLPVFVPDSISNDVLISSVTASRLKLKVGDELRMYYLLPGEHQPRGRKFSIAGIYDTGLTEFDKKFMFGDLRHLQRLNKWNENQAGIVELVLNDYDAIDKTVLQIAGILDYDLEVWNVRDLYPEIFNWLDLLDMNVLVIIVIMVVVAMINIVTILLIRILEKTTTIGILKALGLSNEGSKRIFFYISATVLLKGLLLGNAIGISLSLIQDHFNLLKLNQETYYVTSVPVYFDWIYLILLNFGVFFIGLLVMLVPSMVISGIYPAKTLRLK